MARFIAAGLLALVMAAAAMVATPHSEVAPDGAADTVEAGELPAPWDDLDGSPWDGTLYDGLAPLCQANDGSWHNKGAYYEDHTCVCSKAAPLDCSWR